MSRDSELPRAGGGGERSPHRLATLVVALGLAPLGCREDLGNGSEELSTNRRSGSDSHHEAEPGNRAASDGAAEAREPGERVDAGLVVEAPSRPASGGFTAPSTHPGQTENGATPLGPDAGLAPGERPDDATGGARGPGAERDPGVAGAAAGETAIGREGAGGTASAGGAGGATSSSAGGAGGATSSLAGSSAAGSLGSSEMGGAPGGGAGENAGGSAGVGKDCEEVELVPDPYFADPSQWTEETLCSHEGWCEDVVIIYDGAAHFSAEARPMVHGTGTIRQAISCNIFVPAETVELVTYVPIGDYLDGYGHTFTGLFFDDDEQTSNRMRYESVRQYLGKEVPVEFWFYQSAGMPDVLTISPFSIVATVCK